MLVLSRKVGEAVQIGDNIRVTLCSIRRDGKVRLGFEAPREIEIAREELLEREKETDHE